MGKEKKFGKIIRAIVDSAAGVIDWHDRAQARMDRRLLIIGYHIASFVHRNRIHLIEKKKTIIGHFAGVVLIAIAMVALFNYALGYEYAYNGKVMGYVKDQEDVIKILDLVREELTAEYGSNIQISTDNITFKRVAVLDKDIDNVDSVLRRFTYLTDMEAEGYGIYVDGTLKVVCVSRSAAQNTLRSLQQEYMEEDDENIQYESVAFVESVQIKPVVTKLAYISSVARARNSLSDLTVRTVEKATYAEKVKYKTEYRESDDMYIGDSKVLQKGVNGKRVVTARITRENGEIVDKDVLESMTIKKSVKKIVVKGTKEVPKTAPTGTYIMPVASYTLSSTYGWRWGRLHEGIDLACATGNTIRASDGGTVVYADWYSGYGLFIEIDHGNGIHTRYGHCSAIDVSVGEEVYQGQKIGEVGNTGNSTGSHCHFEITVNGTAVDPYNYL